MSGLINFGLLDTRAPERAANAFYEGQQQQQNSLMNAAKLQGVQRQNKLADLAMADDEATRSAYQASGGDMSKVLSSLQQGGQYKSAMELQSRMSAQQKEAAAADKAKVELGLQRLAGGAQIMSTAKDQASYSAARQQMGQLLGPESVANLPEAYDQTFVESTLQKGQTMAEQLTQKWKAMDAELNREKFGYQQRNDAENRGVQLRGQNISAGNAAASREQSERHFQVSQGPGSPAYQKQNKEFNQKTGDAKDVLTLLDEVDTLLPNATGSYLGAAVDQGARAFGASTSGSVATAQLKTLQGGLISKMPKMSGPQSDKDVQLYREMAGQVGDETLPVKSRQAASAMIRRLNEKYAGMPAGASNAPAGGAYSDAKKEARYQAYKASQGK